LPLVLPPTVTGYYLIWLAGRNGLIGEYIFHWTGWNIMFTWYAAVLASFVVALPLMLKTTRAAIESVDPNLINISYTLGHGELKTFFKVILPLSKKGMVAERILSMPEPWANSVQPHGCRKYSRKNDTMPNAIYTSASSGDWSKGQHHE
jgi:molybdate transport system permease protein